MAVVMIGGCNSRHAQRHEPGPISVASPSPTPWPSYLAKDFENRGHPKLTTKEMKMIRLALARVEPCQRVFLRYAFPSDADVLPFILFFQGPAYEYPHVFWTNNSYY